MLTSATNLRARLSRDELHQLRWLLGLVLVLLAFWTLYSLEVGNAVELVIIMVVTVSAFVLPGWPGRLPGWAWWWFLPIGAFLLLGELATGREMSAAQAMATGNFDMLSMLVQLVTLLALYRALQYRRRREDWQLVLLCLFIIVLAGTLTLSLLFGLQILLFTLVAMALLFVMNLLEAESGRALTAADWRHFRWPHFLRRLVEALNLRLLLAACGLFAAMAVVSSIIFVVMPRYQFDQSFSFPRMTGSTGFRGDIEYKSENSLAPDDTIALRVDVPGWVVFTEKPYWRMIVLDTYARNSFRLSPSLTRYNFDQKLTRFPVDSNIRLPAIPGAKRPLGRWRFYLEGNVSEYLPVLGLFDSLTFSIPQNFYGSPDVYYFRTDQPSTSVLGYEIENMDVADEIPASAIERQKLTPPSLAKASADAQKPGGELVYPSTCVGLPTDPADQAFLRQIVAKIRGGRADLPLAEFVSLTVKYLRDNHPSSLSVSLGDLTPNEDILMAWLRSNSGGWCEHYAGAFALLARAAGYPTRVVAGYCGATYNASENYYFVRQSDAHTWDEVYNGSDRWLRVDPSPGAGDFVGGAPDVGAVGAAVSVIPSDDTWSAQLDGLRMLWYRRVINFDQTDQEEAAEQISDYGHNLADHMRIWFGATRQSVAAWFMLPLTAGRFEWCAAVLLLLGLALRWQDKLRNRWLRLSGRGLLARMNALAPVRRDAGRWLRRFLPVWQAAAPTLPLGVRAEWESVRLDLLALRYGPPDEQANPAGVFRHARELLKRAPRSA